ncbi:(Fe-S)-binding protein [Siccirubricoccus sp. KC 17139]|uniref:(Fe-S)-binding protein n=1 Tax=Siccirubricoccus soli TaxID=2899147 RepID=A0ABT1D8L4_9PROT|nr:(Fe-S)-binding protein [Siccirubricoccus soli]MCO6417524.1 (Fe-S)-binding protein [Siccirubricoccus soli]MCP2683659.1 (Fe-S)-binding protein [Siccirubricoccus soli]
MTENAAIFWYGCNMTRHGEVIRATTRFLEAVGVVAEPSGGPAHCCGSPKDASARINEGMARRTIQGFNQRGAAQVVTWCPSCHMNMQDSMAPVTPTNFETVHVTEVLHARQEKLRPLLARAVPRRVLLHQHLGFNGRVPVNSLVADLLRLIPGLELVEHPYRSPGHMCSSLAGVPGALADAQRATLAAMAETGADTLCTIFHSCHRDAVSLERRGIRVANWIHLLAESAGWPAEDEYKAWRNAADAGAAIGAERMEAAGSVAVEKLVLPELAKPPVV